MSKEIDGVITEFDGRKTFDVVPLNSNSIQGSTMEEVTAFWNEYDTTTKEVTASRYKLGELITQTKAIERAIAQTPASGSDLSTKYGLLVEKVTELSTSMYGSPTKLQIGEKTKPTIGDRLFAVSRVVGDSTYGPTETSKEVLTIINSELLTINSMMDGIESDMSTLVRSIISAGGPLIEGIDVR
jgi:hypothetical protein